MNFPVEMIYIILIGHYVSDFLCQTDWMALNKSSNNKALLLHIGAYTASLIGAVWFLMLVASPISIGLNQLIAWGALNGAIHLVTDYISSRMSKRAYESGNLRRFWAIVGADQLAHYVALVATWTAMGL